MAVQNYPYNDTTQLSPHFNIQEFRCKCGRPHDILVDTLLIEKLEQLYSTLGCSSIRVTSGHRCSEYDKSIGNSGKGQHILGKAADVCCYDSAGVPISSKHVCCKAQDLGFGGIANITVGYLYTHLDVRSGSFWYGDETVSNNTVTSDFYDYFKEARTVSKGIDVSVHQGKINWSAVKQAGIEFALLRAGYGKLVSQKDSTFETNYANATAVGLAVGAYWYSYATTVSEARQEAEVFATCIAGKKFNYPIYLDLEDRKALNTGKSNCSAMVRAFCEVLENKGYWVGLYTSRSFLNTYIEDDIKSRYALWIADWSGSLKYDGTVGIWQSSEKGTVAGISGNVDLDTSYVDYPSVVPASGKNGYTFEQSESLVIPDPPFPGEVTSVEEPGNVPYMSGSLHSTIDVSITLEGRQYTGTLNLGED